MGADKLAKNILNVLSLMFIIPIFLPKPKAQKFGILMKKGFIKRP